MKLSKEEVEARVVADYRAVEGRLLRVRCLWGYRDCDSVEVYCNPPALVRVERGLTAPGRLDQGLLHRCDTWYDPYWDVDLVESHPRLAGIGSLWMDGTSYDTATGAVHRDDWELVPENPCVLQLRRLGAYFRAWLRRRAT